MKQSRHLTTEALIDLAEGTREDPPHPHLRSCEACRDQLAGLRTALSAAAEVEVPEPSPLYWEHLSDRVHEAVAARGAARSRFLGWGWAGALPSWRAGAAAGVAAAVMISMYLTAPRPSEPLAGGRDMAVVPDVRMVPLPLAGATDDPALALVADLTSQMDQDAFDETGWTSHAGAADEAVDTLTDDERLELHRLLKEELAKS
jgi:hypothetical protein